VATVAGATALRDPARQDGLVAGARYPDFAGKRAEEAMFTPADFIGYLRSVGAWQQRQAPAGGVLCYQRSRHGHVLRAEGLAPPGRQGALGLLPLPSTGAAPTARQADRG